MVVFSNISIHLGWLPYTNTPSITTLNVTAYEIQITRGHAGITHKRATVYEIEQRNVNIGDQIMARLGLKCRWKQKLKTTRKLYSYVAPYTYVVVYKSSLSYWVPSYDVMIRS